MIYLIMSDQSFREVADATTARVEYDEVVCYSIEGLKVATFDAASVSAFGKHEALRDPDSIGSYPAGGGVRRERELTEAPLSSVRLA
jgi:hypothetical protein